MAPVPSQFTDKAACDWVVKAISDAAERAAALTAQLLAFSRQQIVTYLISIAPTDDVEGGVELFRVAGSFSS